MTFEYKGKKYIVAENIDTNCVSTTNTYSFVAIYEVLVDEFNKDEDFYKFIGYFFIDEDTDEEIEKESIKFIDKYESTQAKIDSVINELKDIKKALKKNPDDKGTLDRLCDAQLDLLELL